jgi:hypothetical protein
VQGWSSAPGVQDCGDGGPHFDSVSRRLGWSCTQWEGDAGRTRALYAPILEWCLRPVQQALGIVCSAGSAVSWNQSSHYARSQPERRPPPEFERPRPESRDRERHPQPGAAPAPPPRTKQGGLPALPWMERHPDREISTALLGSLTKWLPMRGMRDPASRREIIAGVEEVDGVLQAMGESVKVLSCVMGAKSQVQVLRQRPASC